jgi:uncharacterized phage infection (PIP) family protein YhgE
MRVRVYKEMLGGLLVLMSCLGGAAEAQNAGCESGIVKLPAGVNGAITLCPALASQMPQVVEQLNQIQHALASQQQQARELRQMMEKMNNVSRGMVATQQAELLSNVMVQLSNSNRHGPQQLEEQMAGLNDNFGGVESKMFALYREKDGAARMESALHGEMGTSIARLDFDQALKQLDSISEQLKQISSTVNETNQRTKIIEQTLDDSNRRSEEALAEQKKAQEQAKIEVQRYQEEAAKAEQVRHAKELADPLLFTKEIPPRAIGKTGRWTLVLSLMHLTGGVQQTPELHLVFRQEGSAPWNVPVPEGPIMENNEMHRLLLQDIGDKMLVCYSAVDPRTSKRRYWEKLFYAEGERGDKFSQVNFNPANEAALGDAASTECR